MARLHNEEDLPQAASVIGLKRGSVLMVKRARPPFQGLWSFPGGRSEAGESAEATARRELLEEAAITVGPLVRIGAFQPAPALSPLVLTVFAARADGAEPRAGDDAQEAAFVPLSATTTLACTAGAVGWVARAVLALSEPPLR